MKAFEIQAYGLDHVKQAERPQPAPGPGQVVVKVKAASLNYRDLLTVMGAYGGAYKLPLVPCSDGAGEVAAVGPGVTKVKPGDRVAGLFFQKWLAGPPTREGLSSAVGGPIDGWLQEYCLLSEEGVIKLPDYLSLEEGATLPCAALTAWRALVVEGNLKAGQRVLVQGTGGVSIFALQFAKMHGAEVIATSSSEEKISRLRALGADHLINYRSHEAWGDLVREITGGEGVDHVVEVGGANTLKESLKSVAIGGHISIVGLLSGPIQQAGLTQLIGLNARVHGISVGSREHFSAMLKAMDLAKMAPVIGQSFDFADSILAFQEMQAGRHFGKIVIRV